MLLLLLLQSQRIAWCSVLHSRHTECRPHRPVVDSPGSRLIVKGRTARGLDSVFGCTTGSTIQQQLVLSPSHLTCHMPCGNVVHRRGKGRRGMPVATKNCCGFPCTLGSRGRSETRRSKRLSAWLQRFSCRGPRYHIHSRIWSNMQYKYFYLLQQQYSRMQRTRLLIFITPPPRTISVRVHTAVSMKESSSTTALYLQKPSMHPLSWTFHRCDTASNQSRSWQADEIDGVFGLVPILENM